MSKAKAPTFRYEVWAIADMSAELRGVIHAPEPVAAAMMAQDARVFGYDAPGTMYLTVNTDTREAGYVFLGDTDAEIAEYNQYVPNRMPPETAARARRLNRKGAE